MGFSNKIVPHFSYRFWCWKLKLNGVLKMLSLLSGFSYSGDDELLVLEGLRGSDDEQGVWFSYDMSRKGTLSITLAYDAADKDIVQVTVEADDSMADRIRLIDEIQSTMKRLEVDDEFVSS
ncbi:hypothetical protein [Hymenobacter koreensis]|uniref:Uncharacterized protein n=1 Tax=Hymenobacter koreensis TaxID=1084523 RepID=A0ABP8J235_9BACT